MHAQLLTFLLVISTCFSLTGQEPERKVYHIQRCTGKIVLDGEPDEAAWSVCEIAGDFWQSVPVDTSPAVSRTEFRMTYDDDFIYVSAICYDDLPGKPYIIQSLKRDYSYPVSDGIGVYFDPFNDKTNGFAFTCNPFGVQREGLLANSGFFGVSTDWDNRWFVETKREAGAWKAEIAIPFKSLRYNDGVKQWRVNFSRNNLKRNEGSAWSPVPRVYNIASLLHTGLLVWDQPPKKPGLNAALIPYGILSHTIDFTRDDETTKPNGGVDAKVAVTSSLNLDLTFNPDFSQVEVDRQQTNLSRFSLFFPERRNFFIENSDLFATFGFSKIRPFFSRNIGLYNGNTIPIAGGARLSGKLDQNWRIGLMDMQTKASAEFDQPAYNFAVGALQRTVLKKSALGAILVNRQTFDKGSEHSGDYNRLAGVDFVYNSKNNLATGKVFYHRTFDTLSGKDKAATAVFFLYRTKNVNLEYNHEYVGENFNPVVGFLGYDKGYFRFENRAAYTWFPEKSALLSHGPEIYQSQYWNGGFPGGKASEFYIGRPLDYQYRMSYYLRWPNTAVLSVNLNAWYTFLRRAFDPTGTNAERLPAATSYEYRDVNVAFASDFRKPFNYKVGATGGRYFNGRKRTYTLEGVWRIQPIAILSMAYERNEIELPSPYASAYLDLLGPKFEFAFTKSVFFTTFIQYNRQIDNLNINARLQWRFKPMSDFYIVYTDNYFAPEPGAGDTAGKFAIRNRGVVFKLNYWLAI
ncbi:MAG: carbohydrate binding family 9 domain-containing protein [Bacteroidia bacterium]|nr:carbohydrate binding family 9 domain-containing protein [Bacteroidia bacterium]